MNTKLSSALAPEEIAMLARAVSRAPSVHNSQPWELAVSDTGIDLRLRRMVLRYHDPDGRDQLMSCGAALTHLELAVRALGRECEVELPECGPVVATVRPGAGAPATAAEMALYRAIPLRRSHRRAFKPWPVAEARVSSVAGGAGEGAVVVRNADDLRELAGMLGVATLVFRDNPAYQRELAVWTAHTFGDHALGASDGIPEEALSPEALPVAGLIRGDTPVPDDFVLAERLAAENLVLICTPGDTRRDHIEAGRALERAWLRVTALGLAGSVITQPLHLTGFRARLSRRLKLGGLPQAILRFGYPAVPAPPSPRLPLGELFQDKTAGTATAARPAPDMES